MSIEKVRAPTRDVQAGEGAVRVDPNDPQFTYRGKTIAIKIRALIWPVIIGCIKNADGSWSVQRDLTGDIFASDPPGGGDVVAGWLALNGGPENFVSAIVLPELNEWLEELFPVEGTPVPPLQQLFVALQGIRFNIKPDGTVEAVNQK